MAKAILTLQYPLGLKGLPIATTSNPEVLHLFKRYLLKEWESKIEQADDEGQAILYRLEYQRLKTALNIFIPEENSNSENSARV